jgi:hypothetical protein
MAQANAHLAISMQANIRATGHSSEEISAALVQLFLNCPAVDPDEAGQKVNVDEFAHTDVEQRARRDQQRVLEALVGRDQQRALATLQAKEDAPTPAQAPAADDRPTGSRALLMEMGDFCVATIVVTDGVTAGLIKKAEIKLTTGVQAPTHPALLSDGGGADVGGVEGHQTQDIDTETTAANPAAVEETTTGHQTQSAPLQIYSNPWAQRRALEGCRLTRHLQRILGGHGDERQEDTAHTPYTSEENKADCREWNTARYGITFHLIQEMDRGELIQEGFVSHQATTGSGGYETASSLRGVIQGRLQPTGSKLHPYTLGPTPTRH